MKAERGNDLPITVVVPVKNEETGLADCLKRLKAFREVVVVDSASTDRTAEVAESYGAKVLNFVWDGKYPKKRNWYLLNHKPSQPWVLFLDADEHIAQNFCEEVARAITSSKHSGYWLNYNNYFLGGRLSYGIPQRKLALFKVGSGYYERISENSWSTLDMEIHEHPVLEGTIGEIHSPIDHKDFKGVHKFLDKHLEYAKWEARRYLSFHDSQSSWDNFTKRQRLKYSYIERWWWPVAYFIFTFFVKRGFMDGGAGLQYALYKSWYFQTIRLFIKEEALNQKTSTA